MSEGKMHPRDEMKALRLTAGLSMTDLASMVAIDTGTLSRIEAGLTETINPYLHEALVEVILHYTKRGGTDGEKQ